MGANGWRAQLPRRLPQGRGFTTIELITVMMMIGILAVVALPRMNDTQSFNERSYHDALRSAIDYARKSAVAARRYTCIVLTAGGAEAFIDANLLPESSGGSVDCATTRLTLGSGTSLPVPANVVLGSGVPATIVFSPLGEPQTVARVPLAASLTIGVGSYTLTLEPWTGLVH